jgi:hypothetical protein
MALPWANRQGRTRHHSDPRQSRFFGKISKDRRTILLAQEDLVIEQSVFTPPAGTPFTTDRVCWRERALIKLDQ